VIRIRRRAIRQWTYPSGQWLPAPRATRLSPHARWISVGRIRFPHLPGTSAIDRRAVGFLADDVAVEELVVERSCEYRIAAKAQRKMTLQNCVFCFIATQACGVPAPLMNRVVAARMARTPRTVARSLGGSV
jgi:hypothetical protein